MCCEKGTQWWRGNFVWKQIAQENTRIQGIRNKMWISMEISLERQFPCSHRDETLQRENWNRTEVPLTQNDTFKDFYVRNKMINLIYKSCVNNIFMHDWAIIDQPTFLTQLNMICASWTAFTWIGRKFLPDCQRSTFQILSIIPRCNIS